MSKSPQQAFTITELYARTTEDDAKMRRIPADNIEVPASAPPAAAAAVVSPPPAAPVSPPGKILGREKNRYKNCG